MRACWVAPGGGLLNYETFMRLSDADIKTLLRVTSNEPLRPRYSHFEMLAMRLHIPKGAMIGLQHLQIYEGPNTIHVIMGHGDECEAVRDDKALFPSDTLIAKVRLFMEHNKK